MDQSVQISIAVMTQCIKKPHLKSLFNCLLSQLIPGQCSVELLIFVDNKKAFEFPRKLSQQYSLRVFQYASPFNIGAVRNEAVRQARGAYVTFLDDDVLISSHFIEQLMEKCSIPFGAMAGISYQLFRRPDEMKKLYDEFEWSRLVKDYGRRDYYSRRIGRYENEKLVFPELPCSNWLGCIGRNLTLNKEVGLKFPFFESSRLGFQDLEFGYRVEKAGHQILLPKEIHLSCLHLFHAHRPGKLEDYRVVFKKMVTEGRLLPSSEKFFFTSSFVDQV